MAIQDHFNLVQKVYVAFYRRPADPQGLRYWAQRVEAEGGNLRPVIDAFANAPEAVDLYFPGSGAAPGASFYSLLHAGNIESLVKSFYETLFDRQADQPGVDFYVGGFKKGHFTAGTILLAVLEGAQGADLAAVTHKLQAAHQLTGLIDGRPMSDPAFGSGPQMAVDYSSAEDVVAGREFLAGVTANVASLPSLFGVQSFVAQTLGGILPVLPLAPVFVSGPVGATLTENLGPGQFVYGAVARPDASLASTLNPVRYSLAPGGDNVIFRIDPLSGVVTTTFSPNFELRPSYTLAVIATDLGGRSSQLSVTVTISNLNEAPTGTDDLAALVEAGGTDNEDAPSLLLGSLLGNDRDPDAGDALAVRSVRRGEVEGQGTEALPGTALAGLYGTLTLNADGSYRYELDDELAAVQALNPGQTLQEVFNYTLADGAGRPDTALLRITVQGRNDAPTVQLSPAEGLDEGNGPLQALETVGTLSLGDVDAGALLDVVTAYNEDLAWSGGTLEPARAQALAQALGAALSAAATGAAPGILPWTFSAEGLDLDFLAAGETLSFSHTVSVTDLLGLTDRAVLGLTITGTNDAPTVAITPATAFVEGEGLQTLEGEGTVSVDDVDLTDLVSLGAVFNADIAWSGGTLDEALAAALVAGFSLSPLDGAAAPGSTPWAFNVADVDLDFLAEGETITFSHTLTALDSLGLSAEAVLDFSIEGRNDDPTVEADEPAGFTEADGAQTLSDGGAVRFADRDFNDVVDIASAYNEDLFWDDGTPEGGTLAPELAAALIAGFSLTAVTDAEAPGETAWAYRVEGVNLDFLAQGQTLTFSHTVTATDSQGATAETTLAFTITGSNDAPTVEATAAGGFTETNGSQTLSGSGTVSFDDLDTGDRVDISTAPDEGITWSGGTLDAAVAAALLAGFSASATDAAAPGSTAWTYAADVNLDFLADGETIEFSHTVTATDRVGGTAMATVSFTITGSNDGPQVSVAAIAGFDEADGPQDLVGAGSIEFVDLDENDALDVEAAYNDDLFWDNGTPEGGMLDPDLANTLLAGFSLTPLGGAAAPGSTPWAFNAEDVNLDFLAEGETITFSHTVTATDPLGISDEVTLDFKITGKNDAPTVSVPLLLTNANISFTVEDLDASDTLAFEAPFAGAAGLGSPGKGVATVFVPTVQTAVRSGELKVTDGRAAVSLGLFLGLGTGGADSLSAAGSSLPAALYGFNGADDLVGGEGHDSLDGGAGADTLRGGAGDDSLQGGAAADRFEVDAGSDTVQDLGLGGDVLIVSAGATATATVASAGFTATSATQNEGTATLSSRAYAVNLSAVSGGTAGFTVRNTLNGTGVQFVGSSLADTLIGATANDTLQGGAGDDSLIGGAGTDVFRVDAGTDTVSDLGTGAGNDALVVSAGATAEVTVTAAWAATAATSNAGTARLGSNGFNVSLTNAGGPNGYRVSNTSLLAMAVQFTGSGFADTLTGAEGTDTLNGGNGDDLLEGAGGADSLVGGAGLDTLDGGAGMDILLGGAGQDTLRGGLDDDSLTGNADVDRFEVDAGTDTVTDLGTGGADALGVSAGATALATVTQAYTATAATGNAGTAELSSNGFNVNLTNAGGPNGYRVSNTAATGASFTGSGFDDTLVGGLGADTLNGGAGADLLTGGDGVDRFVISGSGQDLVLDLGLGGADALVVQAGSSVLATVVADYVATGTTSNTSGTAVLESTDFDINMSAATGNAGYTLQGTGTTGIVFTGSAFADTLVGGLGDDILAGGVGQDVLRGDLGNDTLTGGAGNDQFRLIRQTADSQQGTEVVTDFSAGDKLGFLDGTAAPGINFTGVGNAAGVALAAGDFFTRASIATLDDGTGPQATAVVVVSAAQTGNQIFQTAAAGTNLYVVVFNSDSNQGEVWFDTNWANAANRSLVAELENTSLPQIAGLVAADFVIFA